MNAIENSADIDQLDFGDIFSVAFFHDAYLRDDATNMGSHEFSRGRGLGYAPALKQQSRDDFLLAHGSPCRAVLLSEACAIDDALGVGRPSSRLQGRLLFARLLDADENEIRDLKQRPAFDRFPLARSRRSTRRARLCGS
jgi:hypothetical protein